MSPVWRNEFQGIGMAHPLTRYTPIMEDGALKDALAKGVSPVVISLPPARTSGSRRSTGLTVTRPRSNAPLSRAGNSKPSGRQRFHTECAIHGPTANGTGCSKFSSLPQPRKIRSTTWARNYGLVLLVLGMAIAVAAVWYFGGQFLADPIRLPEES